MKFVLSLVHSLHPCRHLLYTFLDVSSYHSNAVSEVAASSHARRSIECEIDQLDRFKGCSGVISCSIFKNKVSMFR